LTLIHVHAHGPQNEWLGISTRTNDRDGIDIPAWDQTLRCSSTCVSFPQQCNIVMLTVYENIYHQLELQCHDSTHIPHSSSSYHSSLGTIRSISSNVRMTLGGLCLLVPVPFAEFVEAIDDRLGFTGNDGAGLSVNRTREGEVTGDSMICDTTSQHSR
jgi:hypothetical protein